MKFKDGYMISSGQPVKEYIDSAVRHVLLRQVCYNDRFSLLVNSIFFIVQALLISIFMATNIREGRSWDQS